MGSKGNTAASRTSLPEPRAGRKARSGRLRPGSHRATGPSDVTRPRVVGEDASGATPEVAKRRRDRIVALVGSVFNGLPPAAERPREFNLLASVVAALIAFGLVMVLSASSISSLRVSGTPWAIFAHQMIWVVLGSVGLSAAMRFDYHRLRPLAAPFLGLCLVALVAVLIPGLGIGGGGASRWIGAGPMRVQPSEIVKLAIVLFISDLLERRASEVRNWRQSVRPAMITLGVVAILLMKQPDMGTTIVVGCIVMALLWVGGVSLSSLSLVTTLGVAGALVLSWVAPYRRARLLSFVNPWQHRYTGGYQVVESLVGVAGGHVLGVGLGSSPVKWGLLPNAYTDFIFAVIASELGFVGAVAVVMLFAALSVVGIRIAAKAPDRYGTLVATGVTAWLITQAIINMGAVIGLLPVTGIPLPFISFGGSSLVIDMTAVGIMLNIAARSGRRIRAVEPL